MKAIQVLRQGAKPTIGKISIPKIASNQVLVKTHYSPIHHFDLMPNAYPSILGIEGSGEIIESLNPSLIGKYCTFYSLKGTWSEYVIPSKFFILPDNFPLDEAALLTLLPVAALALQKLVFKQRFFLSGANSSLGKLLLRLTKDQHPICLVRNSEGFQELKLAGIEYVIDQTRGSFHEYLGLVCKEFRPAVGVDLVAGQMTGMILKMIDYAGILHQAGGLSGKTIQGIDFNDFVSKSKSIKGFSFKSYEEMIPEFYKEIFVEPGRFKVKIAKSVGFNEFEGGLLDYKKNMKNGKVLLRFS